jgi:hypothetical protein
MTLRDSLKDAIREDGNQSSQFLSTSRNEFLYATKDTCINRENPNRSVNLVPVLVAGFDADGTFDNLVPSGITHGFWTLATTIEEPSDGSGAVRGYLAQALIEFDLNQATLTNGGAITGATAAERIDRAQISLVIAGRSVDAVEGQGITIDFHRFATGACGDYAAPAGVTEEAHWGGNATWWEWDYSGNHISKAIGELDGTDTLAPLQINRNPIGSPYIAGKYPPRRAGTNNWNLQGLGATGGAPVYTPLRSATCSDPYAYRSAGEYSDFHEGSTADIFFDNTNLYACTANQFPSVILTPTTKQISLDITDAVRRSFIGYGGYLRILIRLRDSEIFDVNEEDDIRAWVAFHSRESMETVPTTPTTRREGLAPVIELLYH